MNSRDHLGALYASERAGLEGSAEGRRSPKVGHGAAAGVVAQHIVVIEHELPTHSPIQCQIRSQTPAVLKEYTGRVLELVQVVLAVRLIFFRLKVEGSRRG